MADQSHLDDKYFVDSKVYNCPFCNRRHVAYHIYEYTRFNWSNDKACIAIFVRCESCAKQSMHLSFKSLPLARCGTLTSGEAAYRFNPPKDNPEIENEIDSTIFFSAPSSFFVLDERVPRKLRELLTEAEGCLKGNFLTGASACARKIIYELSSMSQAHGENYDDRVKSLKVIHPEVDPTFFDTLLTVQQITSSKVHENALDSWSAGHLKVIIAALHEVLHEIYVVPALRADRRKQVLALKDELVPKTKGVSQES